MIKFGYTILYVADVSKTSAFYQMAFGFQQKFITPDNDYAELFSGDTTLSFASINLANSNLSKGFIASSPTQKPFGIELGFVTAEVEKTLQSAMAAGATLVEPAKTKPWGQTVAYVRDLNGFLIEICSPMES
ncbi:MAG: VOC family protein [Cyclobacteriaceae bacterium]|nr:VOC family protein [Cyclobacteriaceae bacterium]